MFSPVLIMKQKVAIEALKAKPTTYDEKYLYMLLHYFIPSNKHTIKKQTTNNKTQTHLIKTRHRSVLQFCIELRRIIMSNIRSTQHR